MGAVGVPASPEEEAEDKVGVVLEVEGDLGKLRGREAVGAEGAEVGPAGLGAAVGEDGDDCGDRSRRVVIGRRGGRERGEGEERGGGFGIWGWGWEDDGL